jgi:hypothetical protein
VGGCHVRGRNWEERGGSGRGVGQHGSAATAGSGSAAARAGGAAWPRRAAGQIGEGPRGLPVGRGHCARWRHRLIDQPERQSARGLTGLKIEIRIHTMSNDFKC